jgi:hypothetical protein
LKTQTKLNHNNIKEKETTGERKRRNEGQDHTTKNSR